MEVLLESDEEEASLLEQMDQQETKQDTWEVQARQHDASNETAKRIQGSSEVLPRDEYSRAPEVYFCCHFCKQKYPLTKDRIPDINKHMNPSNRYNQVLKIPERLSSSFRENVSWSVMVAKDKSKALQDDPHSRAAPVVTRLTRRVSMAAQYRRLWPLHIKIDAVGVILSLTDAPSY
ncbi:hypothetical protein O3P69_015473 [Scylla paramamosain]|uniref:Uncharacterized protein n=1 Tax=Scylla paramamosain TaxID=85552 RepID=A0AAW0T6V4_SCYPA